MTEPSHPAQPVPQQLIQLGAQPTGVFANHIAASTDGTAVFITFSQTIAIMPPGTQQVAGELQQFQNVPMIASPVAKVVIVPKMLAGLIENLQKLAHQIEQHQTP